ncbi:hypothetical protein EON65_48525 [archaeon]|nr:MAG: hypothetical protein EON65_48525 [archaeon]
MIRSDLRQDNQPRDFVVSIGQINDADGSSSVSSGQTIVKAQVIGPAQPKYSRHENPDRASLEVEVDFLVAEPDKVRSNALSQYLTRVLCKCLALDSFPRQLVLLKVLVIRDDGAVFSTALNAACIALLDASLSMFYFPVAVEIVGLEDKVLVDPTTLEETNSDTHALFTFNASSSHEPIHQQVVGCVRFDQICKMQDIAQDAARMAASTFRTAIEKKVQKQLRL